MEQSIVLIKHEKIHRILFFASVGYSTWYTTMEGKVYLIQQKNYQAITKKYHVTKVYSTIKLLTQSLTS